MARASTERFRQKEPDMTWRPIATAPKNVPIIVLVAGLPWPGHLQDDGKLFSNAHGLLNEMNYGGVTTCKFWMPMIEPPKQSTDS